MRIIVYTDAAGLGGAEISLAHLVAATQQDIQITVVGVVDSIVQTVAGQRPRTQTIVLPSQGIRAWIAHWLTFQQLQPDLIHFNCCTPWANAIGLSAALVLPQVRIVRVDQLPLRTTDARLLWRTRALCLRVDAHVAVGQFSARRMEDFYALGRNSVISIPNGVPDTIASVTPQTDRKELVVGSIGRLDAMKGHDLLLRAVAPLADVRVVILGEGEQRQNLQDLAETLGIADRVCLKGWVDAPRTHLADFDVIAMPSRSEGFPLAMVEAMLASRPVVAAQVGSMPEAIVSGETGLLIEKDNVAELTQALQQLRDDPALRLRLGQQARSAAVTHWTVEAMVSQYQQLWQQTLSTATRPRIWVPQLKD